MPADEDRTDRTPPLSIVATSATVGGCAETTPGIGAASATGELAPAVTTTAATAISQVPLIRP